MKSLTIELPDKLAQELDAVIGAGWFSDEGEAVRAALREFLRRQRPELIEQFQRDDIAWALEGNRSNSFSAPTAPAVNPAADAPPDAAAAGAA